MGSKDAGEIPKNSEAEGSDTSIEIKIKTLDSQTYTLRVDKQMPVPALKERVASVTGVLSEQQRLICRGRVLNDDQLLSAYHVEEGHTLHLVVRQPVPPSSESSPSQPEPGSNVGHSRGPSIVIETFSMPHPGDGVPAELSRVVSAILGSIGIPGIGSSEGTVAGEHGGQRLEGISNGTTQPQHEQAGGDASIPLQPHVIPDSLTTLSQYLGQLKREFDVIRSGEGNNVPAEHDAAFHSTTEGRDLNSNMLSGSQQQGLPSPASLAQVLLSARQFLSEQAGDSLLQLARQLENQANVGDPLTRSTNQSRAFRTGVLFHNLGAFLLELGRSITTLRLGHSPSEAMVNAGPAVFLSPSGPNPLMVQPFNFQSGAGTESTQMGTIQPGSSIINRVGTGIRPRRIDIQIRRGSLSVPNSTQAESVDSQQQLGQRNVEAGLGSEVRVNQETSRVSEGPSFVGDSGIRFVPVRTMVAGVPGSLSRLPTGSTGNTVGTYYPMLATFQHAVSGSLNGNRESQSNVEHNPGAAQYVQGSYERHRQNTEDRRDNGPRITPGLRQQEPSNALRSVGISTLSAGMNENTQDDGQIQDSVLQYIRNIFPGSEVHVENTRVEAGSSDQVLAGTSNVAATAQEEEGRASGEGIILSNILQQIMPIISQSSSTGQNVASGEANVSDPMMAVDSADQVGDSNAGTSRRPSDSEQSPPSSKRQKME